MIQNIDPSKLFLRFKEEIGAFIVTFISWEAWKEVLISFTIALVGGFLAAAGKQLHKSLYDWNQRRKNHTKKEKV